MPVLELRLNGFFPIAEITTITYKEKEYQAIAFTKKKLWENGKPAGEIQKPGTEVICAFVVVRGGKTIGLSPQKEIYYDGKKIYERLSWTDILGTGHSKQMGLKLQRNSKLHHLIREVKIPIEAITKAIEMRGEIKQ